ncbi:SpoIIE family protein phosphatase [Rugosimonospora africana]|uniref:Transcriptional regulator n=1 Tax=Rugosimonospora africana TaxID=556532 RepID=A0A8J3VRW3_9ACTN|nr:SpoIIE family protein phosphatase [Rugosimonospora africana]GIH15896.1 transcriptional regulator [Rugosimonospora africana]
MSAPAPVHAEDLGWWAVSDAGTAGAVRRAATNHGRDLGLPEPRLADLALVASELASNLHKHAQEGVINVRALRGDTDAGIELIAIDSGPGMTDLGESMRDGHSTVGTLGIGLGAIVRKATAVDAYSRPGSGTVLTAAVWGQQAPPDAWSAGLTRPITGETVSGDGYQLREIDGRHQALLCDGLGHGPLAATASRAITAAFRTAPPVRPAGVIEHLHRSVSHTRGAVTAVIDLDPAGTVRWASLGNIAGWVVGATGRRGLTAQPGFVGDRQRRTVREYEYPLAGDAVVVLHSDGLTDRWDVSGYPGLLRRSPLVIAAMLLRDAGIRRDDAGVLVARLAGPS